MPKSRTAQFVKGMSQAFPLGEGLKGIMSGVGYGRAVLGGAQFEPGPAGTTIAHLAKPIEGGDVQALGNVILVNPGVKPEVAQSLISGHELGHVMQSEMLGPFLPIAATLSGTANMLRGKDFYNNAAEQTALPMANMKMAMEGADITPPSMAKGKAIKGYQGGTMPTSKAVYTPGQASAWQSPYQVGDWGAGGGGFGYMKGLLERQMKLKEAMAKAQLSALAQQQRQAQWEMQQAKLRAAQGRYGRGLSGGGTKTSADRFMTEVAPSYMAEALHGPMATPGLDYTTKMISAIGVPAAHQGLMQSGQILGGLGQQALSSGYGLAAQQSENQARLQQQMMANQAYLQAVAMGQSPGKGPGGGSYEKGGRVPKTGTYKLHKGEVVLNKKQSDMMFPMPPQSCEGKPKKSYQEGSMTYKDWGLLAPVMNLLSGRYNLPQQDPTRYAMGTQAPVGLGNVPIGMGPGPIAGMPGAMAMAPPSGIPSVMREQQPQMAGESAGIPGLSITEEPMRSGQGTVNKYTLTGKPETEEERIKNLREDADRQKEKARLQRSRANLLLTYADKEGELNPMIKKHIQERQWLAQQYDQDAQQSLAEAEALSGMKKEAESRQKIAEIEAGAVQDRAIGQLQGEEIKAKRDILSDMQNNLGEILTAYSKGQYEDAPGGADAAFVQGITNALGPSAIMIMSQNMGKSVQDTLDTIRAIAAAEVSGRTEAGEPVAPGEALKLLWIMMGESPPSRI